MFRKSGFTLIELLVVIAIIAILASILFPVFAKARAKARQAQCASNLKSLGMAFVMYAQDYDETFPPTDYDDAGVGRVTWPSLVNPYIKSGIQKQVGQLENKNQKISIFVCPEIDASPPDAQLTVDIAGTPGSRGLLSYATNRNMMPAYRSDPLTVRVVPVSAVGEPAQLVLLAPNYGSIPDTTGRDDLYTSPLSHPQAYMNVRTRHNRGANFAFTDGHVKWFAAPPDFRACSRAGIVQQHRNSPNGAADAGWFAPLSGTVAAPRCP